MQITPRFLATLILILSVGIWSVFLTTLFLPGNLMNADHPLHQGLLECARTVSWWNLPIVWCDHLMAGFAPFQSYPILFYGLVLFFMKFVPLSVAYKLGITLAWLSIPLTVGLVLFLSKRPLAGAIAFSLLLLEHGSVDMSGIEFLILKGSAFNQQFGWAFLFVTLMCGDWFLREPSWKKVGWLSLSTSVYFLFHPSTFYFFGFPLAFLLWHYYPIWADHKVKLVAYPIMVFLLVSFWFIPFLTNSQLDYAAVGGGSRIILSDVRSFILDPVNPVLLIIGGGGLVFLLVKRVWPFWMIPAMGLGILLLEITNSVFPTMFPLPYLQIYRLWGLFRVLLLISAAICLEKGLTQKYSTSLVIMSAVIMVYLIGSSGATSLDRINDIYVEDLSENNKYLSLEISKINETRGRILAEETFGQTSRLTNKTSFWGISPFLFEAPVLNQVISYPKITFGGTAGGKLFGYNIHLADKSEVMEYLDLFNIEYVLAASSTYKNSFLFLQPIGEMFGTTIFFNNATSRNWFKIRAGTILEEKYSPRNSRVIVNATAHTIVLFKVRYWPYWKATVDGTYEVRIEKSEIGLMKVKIAPGVHTIEFTYLMNPILWVGWIFTGLGIVCTLTAICAGQCRRD